jgi:hypothetical protein
MASPAYLLRGTPRTIEIGEAKVLVVSPTAEQIAAAMDAAGVESFATGDTRTYALSAREGRALRRLARYVIVSASGVPGWPDVPHVRDSYDLRSLSDDAASCFGDDVLFEIGMDALRSSAPTDAEGKLSGPP